MRVRIAECVYNAPRGVEGMSGGRYLGNHLDGLGGESSGTDTTSSTVTDGKEKISGEEKRVLDKVGEALARLGRVKRVALTTREKAAFVEVWAKRRK